MKHQPPTPTLARIAERYGRKLADVEDDYGERFGMRSLCMSDAAAEMAAIDDLNAMYERSER